MPLNSLRDLIEQDSEQGLFDLLMSFCQCAIAIDEQANILWLSEDYKTLLSLPQDQSLIGVPITSILPTTQMPRVVKSGKPIFIDLMQINDRWCAVTRLPIKNPQQKILGAIGFVFYDDLDSLQPLFDKFARLKRRFEDEQIIRPSRYALDDMIGTAQTTNLMRRQALRASQLDTTLLLLGETGTGKELLAQGIHNASPRREGPFVGINMAALPESLAEAELFGNTAGAFTGADRQGRVGKIKLADGGTLFLDEIAEMPMAMQAKLLRVLQEREIEALGSNRLETIDVRVIAATSKDLKQQVIDGNFREDLYYRLNVLPLNLPPLRERISDLPALTKALLQEIQHQGQLPSLTLSVDAMHALEAYHWPGNIRELRNKLERGCVMAEGEYIEPVDMGLDDTSEEFQTLETRNPLPAHNFRQAKSNASLSAIKQALQDYQGNKSATARALGISRATLYKHLRQL